MEAESIGELIITQRALPVPRARCLYAQRAPVRSLALSHHVLQRCPCRPAVPESGHGGTRGVAADDESECARMRALMLTHEYLLEINQ